MHYTKKTVKCKSLYVPYKIYKIEDFTHLIYVFRASPKESLGLKKQLLSAIKVPKWKLLQDTII